MSGDLARIVDGFVANWIQLVGRGLLSFVELAILYRYFPGELVGVWLVLLSAGQLVNLTDLGVGPTLSRFVAFRIPKDLEGGSPEGIAPHYLAIRTLMASAYAMAGVLAFGLIGAAIWMEPVAASRFAVRMNPDLFRAVFIVFIGGMAVNAVGSVPLRVLNGVGSVAREQHLRLGFFCGRIIMEVASVLLGWGLLGLAAANLLAGIFTWAGSSAALFHAFPALRRSRGTVRWQAVRDMVGPSARWLLMTIGGLMIFNTSNVLIGWFLGAAAVPDYAALYQLVFLGASLIGAVPGAFVPFIAREYAHGNMELIRRYHQLAVKLTLVLAGLSALILWRFGEDILRIWLGAGHFVGRPVLGLLLVLVVLECHQTANAACAMALNKIPFGPWAIGAGLLTFLFAALFIPRLGLVGMPLASLLAQLLTNDWFAVYYTLRALKTGLRAYFRYVLSPALWTLVPVGILSFALRHRIGASAWELVLDFLVLGVAWATSAVVVLPRGDAFIQSQLPKLKRFGILS